LGLDFLPSVGGVCRYWFPFDFGTDEVAPPPPQVLELQGTFSSRLPPCPTPELLPQASVSPGQETEGATSLAGQAGEPQLFPGCPERQAGARLAEGPSRLLEKHHPLPTAYLTRRLLSATNCGTTGCCGLARGDGSAGHSRRPSGSALPHGACVSGPYLTRPLLDAHSPVCRADLHVHWQYLTRRHRRQHPAAAKQGARHSGHGARHERERLIA